MTNTRMMTAAALAAMLAVGAAPAAMADEADATIELNAVAGGTLEGHRYTAYRIGSYENAEESGGKVSRVDVVNADGAKAWLTDALSKTGTDRTKGCDEAGTIAHLTDAAKTRAVASALAKSDAKPEAAAAVDGSGASATLSVPEGLYLVADSDGQPVVVGTKINGLDLASQTLGVANVKVWSVPLTLAESTGAKSTNVGDVRSFKASFTSPIGVPATLMLTIGGKGFSEVETVTAKAGSDTESITVTGGTADLTAFAAAHPGERVELDYNAKVTASGPTESDAAESKDTLTVGWDDDVTRSSEASVSLLSFRFGLDKVSAADTTQHLSGAGFKVQGPDGWLVKGGTG